MKMEVLVTDNEYYMDFKKAILNLEKYKSIELYQTYRKQGDFIEDILVPVLFEIGEAWTSGTVALAQVYMSSKICEAIISLEFPHNEDKNKNSNYDVAIVTLDDYHELGKQIVYSTMKGFNINVLDLGCGLNSSEIVKQVILHLTLK